MIEFILITCLVVTTVTICFIVRSAKRNKSLDNIMFILAASCFIQLFIVSATIELSNELDLKGVFNAFMLTKKSMGGEVALNYITDEANIAIVVILYILWSIAIIATGSVVISVISKINNLFISRGIVTENVCVFTELNQRTLMLGKSIYDELDKKSRKKHTIIYLVDDVQLSQKTEFGFPIKKIRSNVDELKLKHKLTKKVEIWDFSFDEKIRTTEIIKCVQKFKDISFVLRIFGTDEVSELRYKSLNAIKSPDTSSECKRNIEVHISNVYYHIAYSALKKNPLYAFDTKGEDDFFDVLIIGCGKFGSAFLEKLFSYGIFLNKKGNLVQTRATILDINAKEIEQKIKNSCPGFFTDYVKDNLRFLDYDVNKDKIEDRINDIKNIDYCIISTNDDELNILTAKRLHTALLRRLIQQNNLTDGMDHNALISPFITRIKDKDKASFFENEYKFIKPFGSDEEIFNCQKLRLDKYDAAMKTLYYIYSFNGYENGNKKDILDYTCNELVELMGLDKDLTCPMSSDDISNTLEEVLYLDYLNYSACVLGGGSNIITKKSDINKLAGLIHERWRCYTLYSGIDCPDKQVLENYQNYTHSHKFIEAHYNAMLVPYSQLDPDKQSDSDKAKVILLPYIMSKINNKEN